MRDLTMEEMSSLRNHQACPFCGGLSFGGYREGGVSLNFYCQACGAGFNSMGMGFIMGGQLIKEPEAGWTVRAGITTGEVVIKLPIKKSWWLNLRLLLEEIWQSVKEV